MKKDLQSLDDSIKKLLQVIADLRGPQGCPWDLEQTHQSLAPFVIEEAHELAEILDQYAVKDSDPDVENKLKDELGDVLFQVVLHAQLAQERHSFSFKDITDHLSEKLIRRHPHVFNKKHEDQKNDISIEEVWKQWEKIKTQEKLDSTKSASNKLETTKSIFDFPAHLPALQRAHKIGVKTQKRKFDWDKASEVKEKVLEELAELDEAIANKNQQHIQEEFGDLLFAMAQWGRHLNLDPEQSLRLANKKFETRFTKMMDLVSSRGLDWNLLTSKDKELLWREIKTHSQSETNL